MDDVVALERADGNEDGVDGVAGVFCDLIEDFAEVSFDGAEGGFVVADEVHLVDGDDEVAHAEQRRDVGVAARLHEDAFAGVDEDDCGIGGG